MATKYSMLFIRIVCLLAISIWSTIANICECGHCFKHFTMCTWYHPLAALQPIYICSKWLKYTVLIWASIYWHRQPNSRTMVSQFLNSLQNVSKCDAAFWRSIYICSDIHTLISNNNNNNKTLTVGGVDQNQMTNIRRETKRWKKKKKILKIWY